MPETITKEEFNKRYTTVKTLTSEEFQNRYGEEFRFGGGRTGGVGAGGPVDETLWEGAKRIAMTPLVGDPYKYFPENPPDAVIEALFETPNTRHLRGLSFKAKQALYGGIAAIGRTGVELTSPLNLVLLATMKKLPSPVARTAAGGFAVSMGSELPRIGTELVEAAKEGDVERVSAGITEGLITAGMTAGAAAGALKKPKIKPAISERKPGIEAEVAKVEPIGKISPLEGKPITPEELFNDTLLRRKIEPESVHPSHRKAGIDKARQVIEEGRIDPEYQHSLIEMREGRRAAVPEKVPELSNDLPAIQRMIRGKDGVKRPAPIITVGEIKSIQAAEELSPARLAYSFENPIRVIGQIGLLEKIYRPMKVAEKLSKEYRRNFTMEHNIAKKGLSGESRQKVGQYATAQRKGGTEILQAAGKSIPKLTADELAYYDWYRQTSDKLFGDINKTRIKAGQEPIPHVEDYFTFQRVLNEMDRVGFDIMTVDPQFIHKRMTVFPFEKATKKSLREIEWDIGKVFDNYLRYAADHVNKSFTIAHSREMLKDMRDSAGNVVFSMQETNPRTYRYLTEWLDYQAGQPGKLLKAPRWIERKLMQLNHNLAFSVLGANIRSAAIQPTAILNTYAEIGSKYTARGIQDLIHPSVEMKAVIERSNVINTREYEIAVTEAMRGIGGKFESAKMWAAKIGLTPLTMLDMQTAKATWYGAYRYAIEFKGLPKNSKVAINFADDIVTKTQASAQRSDLAPIQRTVAGRAMTMFQTFVINNWGFLRKDVLGIDNIKITNRAAFKKASRWIIGSMLVNILYEDVLGIYSPLGDPLRAFKKGLDKGDPAEKIAFDIAKELAEPIPMVGGSLRYGSSPLGATPEFVSEVQKLAAGKPTRLYWWETIGMAYGIPGTKQVAKWARAKKRKEK